MSNPKYKLTAPCPCCNSQVTVESYTDQPPKLAAVPSPTPNAQNLPPKPTVFSEAMATIANSGVNILGSGTFAYDYKGLPNSWGAWDSPEQRRIRQLEQKISDLQRTLGHQGDSLRSAHERIKSLEQAEHDCKQMDLHLDKAVRAAHKRITELKEDQKDLWSVIKANARAYNTHLDSRHTGSAVIRAILNPDREVAPPVDCSATSPTPENPPEARITVKDIESLARLVSIAADHKAIKNFLEGYFIVKDNEAEKWRKMMEVKADKLNEITSVVFPAYEQGNPENLTPFDVYSRIKDIIMRPEFPITIKESWAH